MSPMVDIGDGGPPINLPEGFWPDRARAALARGDKDLSITRQIREVLDREHTPEDLHMLRSRGHSWRVLLNHELSRRRHGLNEPPKEEEMDPDNDQDIDDEEGSRDADPQEPQEPLSQPDPPSRGDDTDQGEKVAPAGSGAAEDLNLAALAAAGYDPMTSIHFQHLTPQERQRYAQRGARR